MWGNFSPISFQACLPPVLVGRPPALEQQPCNGGMFQRRLDAAQEFALYYVGTPTPTTSWQGYFGKLVRPNLLLDRI